VDARPSSVFLLLFIASGGLFANNAVVYPQAAAQLQLALGAVSDALSLPDAAALLAQLRLALPPQGVVYSLPDAGILLQQLVAYGVILGGLQQVGSAAGEADRELADAVVQLAALLYALVFQAADLGVRVSLLSQSLSALQQQVESLPVEDLAELEEAVEELGQAVCALQQQASDLSSAVGFLSAAVSGLQAEVSGLGEEAAQLSAAVAVLQSAVEALEQRCSAAEGSILQLQSAAAGLAEDLENVSGRVSQVEEALQEVWEAVSALQESAGVLQQQVSALSAAVSSLEDRVSQVEAAVPSVYVSSSGQPRSGSGQWLDPDVSVSFTLNRTSRVVVMYSCGWWRASSNLTYTDASAVVNGTVYWGAKKCVSGGLADNISFMMLLVLPAGSYTVRVLYRVDQGTLTVSEYGFARTLAVFVFPAG